MVYKNKARDMKRAPLPSRAYKSARKDKRIARKQSRQHARQLTHNARNLGWDDTIESLDPDWDNMARTRRIVRRRRYADNLGALMSWAQALADRNPDTPPDELRLKVREIVGWDYMADHLMSHVETIDAYDINPTRYAWRRRSYNRDGFERTREERIEKLTKHCQDLWLSGQNKKLHRYAQKCSSRTNIEGWERKTFTEPIYKFGYVHPNKRYMRVFTGEYKEVEYWIRRCLSYDEIPRVVEGWFRANYSAASALLVNT